MKRLLAILILPAFIVIGCGTEQQPENEPKTDNEPKSADNTQTGLKTDPKPEMSTEVVATVNGVPIYREELKGRPVKDLISEEIIYQKGLGLGLEDKFTQKLRNYRKQLIVNDLKSDILEELPAAKEVSDEEILQYYEDNQPKYSFVRMHELGFTDDGLGEDITKRLEAGEEASEIASSYSDSGVNVLNRDLGYSKEMLKYFNNIEVGAVTEVITKPDGSYSIVKIVEIKPIPLRQSERAIKRILEAKRKTNAYNAYADKIIQENGVEIEMVGN